ncbi:MAG: multidrug efflux MFS transporter [Oligosphaeraceae bacterium]|jgi:DHA1 family multidrug resistance protein-like MFS transporter|nr:multidrug efflux MFS transporter [Oligosphaeraceae bacterium]
MPAWVINLIILWLSQFCAAIGFSLSLPFAPYYIQTLGVTDPGMVKIWTTVVTAGAPLTMALVSPLWGWLSDRHGRKPMVLRATWGAGVILFAAAFAPNVYVFVFLRTMQGMFSGVASAVITLVACNTPAQRQGLALGSLGSAQFSGHMFGMFIGGFMAEQFGYANTFLISGIILAATGLLVWLFVKEKFTPPPPPSKAQQRMPWREKFAALGPGTLLLGLILWMSVTRRMDGGLLAIYIQELYGGLEGVAIWSGIINASGSLGALLSGILASLLIDRLQPRRMMTLAAAGAAASMLFLGLATSHQMLIPARFLLMLFLASFDPTLQAWLSRVTLPSKKGVVFGLAQTAKSTGMTIGPCLGGIIAWAWSTRLVFWTAAAMFLLLIPLVGMISERLNRRMHAAE